MIKNTIETEFNGDTNSLKTFLNDYDLSIIRISKSGNVLNIYSNLEYTEDDRNLIISLIQQSKSSLSKSLKSYDSLNLKNIDKISNDLNNYGTPSTSPLKKVNNTYSTVIIEGESANAPSNLSELSINYDGENNLYAFNVLTSDGVNTWWYDLKGNENTFNLENPYVAITSSKIPNLDGEYWVNSIGDDFVMVSIDRGFSLYFTNGKIKYTPSKYDQKIAVIDNNGFLFNSDIKVSKYNSDIYFSERENINLSSSKYESLFNLKFNAPEKGRYKLNISFRYQISTKRNPSMDYLINLNSDKLEEISIRELEGNITLNENYNRYLILNSGENEIDIQFKSKHECLFKYFLIEVLRIN